MFEVYILDEGTLFEVYILDEGTLFELYILDKETLFEVYILDEETLLKYTFWMKKLVNSVLILDGVKLQLHLLGE